MLSLCRISKFGLRRHLLYALGSNCKIQCRPETRGKVQIEAAGVVESKPKIVPITNPPEKEQVKPAATVQAPTGTVQPATATAQPPAATVKPPATTVQSAVATVQPAAATVKPPAAIAQSAAETVQPAAATAKPPAATVQSAVETVQPAAATVKSPAATAQPSAATVKPPTATVKPPTATVQSAAATVKPPTATVQSAAATVKPPAATGQSTAATVKPPTTSTPQPKSPPASAPAKEETGLLGASTLQPEISGPMIVEEKIIVKKEALISAAPFDEVPGPLILKFMAKLHSRLPLLGNQLTVGAMSYFLSTIGSNLIWNRSTFAFTHMFDKYGPVVRLQGIFGGDIVFISRPEHIEAVYKHEGQHPVRSSLDSLDAYRKQHREMRIVGPFLMSGREWEALRLKLEEPLQKKMNNFHAKIELIADLMVNRISKIRNKQEEVPATFNDEIYKWALENLSGVVMGWYLGLLSSEDLDGALESTRLLEAVKNASQALRTCESGFQTWRFVKNRTWRKLVNSCDIIDSIIVKYIRLAQQQLNNKKEGKLSKEALEKEHGASVLESLLLAENMHPEDILTIVLDMLIIGVNATSHALVFLLYHLSKAPKVQRKAFEELLPMMPYKDSPISHADVKKLKYLHACVRESLRLQPPLPVITRILPEDVVVHNYAIPKGTFMLMATHVTTLRHEHFEDPTKYEPDRWLSESSGIHPFAAIPFGYGPRSCVGKGIAELQLWLTAAKIIRNFTVEFNYGTIQSEARLIAMPKKPLKFRFVDRTM